MRKEKRKERIKIMKKTIKVYAIMHPFRYKTQYTTLHYTHFKHNNSLQLNYDLPKANKSSIKVFKNRNIRNFHGR